MSPNPLTRRGRSFVDAEVQGGLLRAIAVHWIILFVVNVLALVVWLRMFEQPEIGWGETFVDCLRRFMPFFVVSLALIPAFIWDTLKLTNRFVGPVLRLRSALASAADGRVVAPLQFRNSDFWHELAEDFNRLAARKDASQSKGS